MISNIAAGTRSQLQAIIDSNLVDPLMFQLQTGTEEAKIEAAYALGNMCSGGSLKQIQ